METPALELESVTKRYAQFAALENFSLKIPRGALYGFVGPNGSGKSTLFKLLAGLILPNAGRIERNGFSREHIGYAPDRALLAPCFCVREYLMQLGALDGLRDGALLEIVNARLHQVGLAPHENVKLGACSKGMLQRVALAAALLSDPPLLILDEPMSGLDPAAQSAMRGLIQSLHREGKTILLSTHRLSDVAELCTHLAILKRGRLLKYGALHEILPAPAEWVIQVAPLPQNALSFLNAPDLTILQNTLVLHSSDETRKRVILHSLLERGIVIESLNPRRASLEQVYLDAMQNG